MKVLLLYVPSRTSQKRYIPIGLLYVAGIIEREGHEARIHDLYLHDLHLMQLGELDRLIGDYRPDIIGFGGIASSYGKTKLLSIHLKRMYPGILQIAGGSLASVAEYLLARSPVDLVLHGETEQTLPMLLHRVARGEDWTGIPGTSHRSGAGIARHDPPPQVEDLDTIPIPPYRLVNLPDYLNSTTEHVSSLLDDLSPQHREAILSRIEGKDRLLDVITSRGCTNRCSFCYRHMKGYRQHSVDYVIRHLRFLIDTYGVRAFAFGDELFNNSREWVLAFCDAAAPLDIMYVVGGARINRMDPEMLRRLRESGCIMIAYGQESGSDAILKEFRKGVTARQNLEMTVATLKEGIACPVQLVIGSPGETDGTIRETLGFLLGTGGRTPSVNYLIPFPETPIWAEAATRIPDVEAYLEEVAGYGGAPLVNLTGVPDRIWRSWAFMLKAEAGLAALKEDGRRFRYLLTWPAVKLLEAGYRLLPGAAVRVAREVRRRRQPG